MKPSLYLVTDLNPLFIRDADVVQPNKKEIVIPQIAQLFAEGNVGKRNVTRTGLSRDAHIDTYDMFEKIALRVLKKIDVIHHRAQIEWALGAQFPPEVSAQVDNIIADNTFNAVSIAPEAYRFLEYLKNQGVEILRILDQDNTINELFASSWMTKHIAGTPLRRNTDRAPLSHVLDTLSQYGIRKDQLVISVDTVDMGGATDIHTTNIARLQHLFRTNTKLNPVVLKNSQVKI